MKKLRGILEDKMDIYNLINSKAIREYCRKIEHQFNTEELAVLIYRNKNMSIEEKISAYEELIKKYPDMEVKERLHCKHYSSVKEMIKEEIIRIKKLLEKLPKEEQDTIYTYAQFNTPHESYGKCACEDFENIYKLFQEAFNAVNQEIEKDENTVMYKIIRNNLTQNNSKIIAEYIVSDNKLKMIDIYDKENTISNFEWIFLNIPTPFKKGDLLVSYCNIPYNMTKNSDKNGYVFVLNELVTSNKNFKELLEKGQYASPDMNGLGYYISDNNILHLDYVGYYDCWEYFDDELKGMEKFLKSVSSLLTNEEYDLMLFIQAYEAMKSGNSKKELLLYTDEALELSGFNKEDIKRMKGM